MHEKTQLGIGPPRLLVLWAEHKTNHKSKHMSAVASLEPGEKPCCSSHGSTGPNTLTPEGGNAYSIVLDSNDATSQGM